MPSLRRRCPDNKSARCALNKLVHQQHANKNKNANGGALFKSPKRPGEYQGYRAPDRPVATNSMPILVGAAIIAVAILLSTLITAVGSRYLGIETPTDETVWLVDRLTGSVYKCQAPERGKASCEAELATGSVGERGKH